MGDMHNHDMLACDDDEANERMDERPHVRRWVDDGPGPRRTCRPSDGAFRYNFEIQNEAAMAAFARAFRQPRKRKQRGD